MADLALGIIGIVGTIDVGIKWGNEIKQICAAIKGAESEIEERRLRLEGQWYRCILQLEFIRGGAHLMDDYHCDLHERMLKMFLSKYEESMRMIRELVKIDVQHKPNGTSETVYTPRRVSFAFKKQRLDSAIASVEQWLKDLDMSWFLLLRKDDRGIDDYLRGGGSKASRAISSISAIRKGKTQDRRGALWSTARGQPAALLPQPPQPPRSPRSPSWPATGMSLPADALRVMSISNVACSEAKVAEGRRSNGTTHTYILDPIVVSEGNNHYRETIKSNLRELAQRLQNDEPQTFGLLSCKGFVVADPQPSWGANITMVFRPPPGSDPWPTSLRDRLLNGPRPDSLSMRVSIAQELARSISGVHLFGFVHKNVRPQTVLTFTSPTPDKYGVTPISTYLVGFQNFREEDAPSILVGDENIEKNLYRHSSRQGNRPLNYYLMQHDIYSLGVCMLEIGLWQSFITYGNVSTNTNPVPRFSEAVFGTPIAQTPNNESLHWLLRGAKDIFVELAQTKLRECMGNRYAEIVETCLTCLDPGNEDFGDLGDENTIKLSEYDADIRVGVRYIEKVLMRLNSISM